MTRTRRTLGGWGERLAATHLTSAGMVLLDRNWRTAAGEIDLIARDGDSLVFIEVKTRRGTAFGNPAEAVGDAKTRRLRALATQWLAASGLRSRSIRFDVVTVLLGPGGPAVTHLRDAF
jgi:putative endonuclease